MGEVPGQQQGGAGVGVPEGVQGLGGHVQDGPVAAAAGVVADEDVQAPGQGVGLLDEVFSGVRVPQVRGDVAGEGTIVQSGPDAGAYRIEVVIAPGLVRVMGAVVVEEHTGPQGGELNGHRVTDAAAAGNPGDQSGSAPQRACGRSVSHGGAPDVLEDSSFTGQALTPSSWWGTYQ